MLINNPRISRLAGLSKLYQPLPRKQADEVPRLLMQTNDYDALPDWLKQNLEAVEQAIKLEMQIEKHLLGQHDQSTHAGGRGSGIKSSGLHHLNEQVKFWGDHEADALKDKVMRDTWKGMKEHGVTYDDVTEYFDGRVPTQKYEGSKPLSEIYVLNDTESFRGVMSLERFQERLAGGKSELTWIELQDSIKRFNDVFGVSISDRWDIHLDSPQTREKVGLLAAREMVHNWAVSSNDDNEQSLALQMAAKKVFSLSDTAEWRDRGTIMNQRIENLAEKNSNIYAAFLQTQYDNTQAYFAKKGIKEVTLFRGNQQAIFNVFESQNSDTDAFVQVKAKQRPLSSWSTDPTVAQRFAGGAGTIYRRVVPVNQIFSSPFTGLGCYDEKEMVVLGHVGQADAVPSQTTHSYKLFMDPYINSYPEPKG